MPNRLQNETSPYLLQHSHNPVDWFPWSAEALSAAKNLNRPILLSIGYSACHWCHVMERESFEDIDTAAFMNDHFINIKVDREERPDLDSIYMDAVQALTGRGGWPMTVFLTPDGVPFFGGTYFPPSDRFGMPAFIRVLRSVASTYVDSPGKIQTSVQQLADILDGHDLRSDGSKPDSSTSLHAFESLKASFDSVHGGFGGAPKFPQPLILNYLLRYHLRTHSPQALTIVIDTLHALRSGGIYDALGGGFHRYSTDAAWLVPHFEKMLYDNALLATTYLEAFAVTGNKEFRLVAEETLAYLTRDMMSDNGSFYSSQDADTDGEEGAYFVWTPAQIDAVLGPDITPIVCDYFGVTEAGNFEGATILHTGSDQQQVADRWKLSLGELDDLIGNAKGQLLRQRQRRQSPSRDDKILASWNGLALKAFATAAKILSSSHYAAVAARTANFLLNTLVTDGRIYRTYSGGRVRFHGYLEDYAAVADGLLALYDVTFEPSYVAIAERLAGTIIDQFWDVETGGFYSTGQEHETLIRRPKDMYDNAVPSGQSTAVHVLLQLYALTGRSHYAECAETTLASFGTALGQAPLAFGNMLSQLEWTLSDPIEIAITGSIDRPDTQALLNVTHSTFQPHNVTAVEHAVAVESGIELLRDRSDIDGQAAAYVCQHHTCLQPIQDPEELRGVLLSTRSRGSLTHST